MIFASLNAEVHNLTFIEPYIKIEKVRVTANEFIILPHLTLLVLIFLCTSFLIIVVN